MPMASLACWATWGDSGKGGRHSRTGRGGAMVTAALNDLLVRVARRAENAPAGVLREAFVPVPSLLAQLESSEHQILFGRRGTGKTHLRGHLQDQRGDAGAWGLE